MPNNAELLLNRFRQFANLGQKAPAPSPMPQGPLPGQGPQRTGDIYLPPDPNSADPKQQELLRRMALLQALQRQ